MAYFFDSWGCLWRTTASNEFAAVFGPSGLAIEANPEEIGLIVKRGETAYAAALRLGLVEVGDDGWDYISEVGEVKIRLLAVRRQIDQEHFAYMAEVHDKEWAHDWWVRVGGRALLDEERNLLAALRELGVEEE